MVAQNPKASGHNLIKFGITQNTLSTQCDQITTRPKSSATKLYRTYVKFMYIKNKKKFSKEKVGEENEFVGDEGDE